MTHRVLVTGGAGYIGSVTAAMLLDRGYDVCVIDSLVRGFYGAVPGKAKFFKMSVGQVNAVSDLLVSEQIDTIIHFAAFTQVEESVLNPEFYRDYNFGESARFLEAVGEAGTVETFIYSSSAAVYGMPDVDLIGEEIPPSPINPYGQSKLDTEHLIRRSSRENGFDHIILRYFNVAGSYNGWGERHVPETHLIPSILSAVNGGSTDFVIYGDDYDTPDGTPIRDYVHVADLADAHIACLESEVRNDIFNVGYGKGASVKDVVLASERVTGRTIPYRIGPRRAGDPDRLVADVKKIKRIIRWTPRHDSLEKIIESAYSFMEQHERGPAPVISGADV